MTFESLLIFKFETIMKKSVVIIIHLGFWSLYLFLLFIIFSIAVQGNDAPSPERLTTVSLSIILIPSIAVFYFYYFKLFNHYEKHKNVLNSIVLGIAFSISTSAIGVITSTIIVLNNFQDQFQWVTSFIPGLIFTFFLTTIIGIIGFIIRAFISWYNHLKLREELITKNHEMELALVKAQLDPHFLFNTLNNIDALIIKEPAKASEFLNKLSDILRFMLFETKNNKISLKKEIEYINKFIDLHRIRSTNPNYILFEVEGSVESIEIAPMVLIPFIENALKHVPDNTVNHAIKIKLTVVNNSIHFQCKNNSSNQNENQNGLGNNLIKKRLDLIYPSKHELIIQRKNDNYSVNLTLK